MGFAKSQTNFGVVFSMHEWVMTVGLWECRFFFNDLDVGHLASKKKVPIETFNVSFESTKNKQQYGAKITCTEVRIKLC